MESRNLTQGIGSRIRSIRMETRLDQEKFGETIGVGRQSISSYETGRLMPARSVIDRISEVYGVVPWWLVFGIKGEKDNEYMPMISMPGDHDCQKLSPAQRLLVEFILDKKTDAKEFAQRLFNKGLNL